MPLPQLTAVMQSINISILPVIVIPVTGLCCLVFYNRLAAINALIHSLYKDMRELYINPGQTEKAKHDELISTLNLEQKQLLKRSNLIRSAIVSCFIGLVAFILSAITILLTIFFPSVVTATLALWILGALCFILGLSLGIFEIKNTALQNITLEGVLFERWGG